MRSIPLPPYTGDRTRLFPGMSAGDRAFLMRHALGITDLTPDEQEALDQWHKRARACLDAMFAAAPPLSDLYLPIP